MKKSFTLTEYVSIINLSTKGDDKLNLQNNVKKIRQAKGVKQKSVAEYLNISQMRYSRIENANKSIDPIMLEKIAKFLDVDVSIFFDDKLTESVISEYILSAS